MDRERRGDRVALAWRSGSFRGAAHRWVRPSARCRRRRRCGARRAEPRGTPSRTSTSMRRSPPEMANTEPSAPQRDRNRRRRWWSSVPRWIRSILRAGAGRNAPVVHSAVAHRGQLHLPLPARHIGDPQVRVEFEAQRHVGPGRGHDGGLDGERRSASVTSSVNRCGNGKRPTAVGCPRSRGRRSTVSRSARRPASRRTRQGYRGSPRHVVGTHPTDAGR